MTLAADPEGFPDLVSAAASVAAPGARVGPAGPPLLDADGAALHRVRGALATGRAPADDVEQLALDEETGARPVHPARPGWQRPGWAEDQLRWVDAVLEQAGRPRTGAPVVLRTWGLSHVERVPAAGGDVVVKTSSAHFAQEPAITAWLADRFPGRAPAVLAVGGAGMVMEPFATDEHPDDPPSWVRAAAAGSLARMQVDCLAHLPSLRSAGAPDRSLRRTRDAVVRLADDAVELHRLSDGDRDRLRASLPHVLDLLDELLATGVPDTLAHGDLHAGNLAAGPGRDVVLYDWSDACVSFPFADAVHLRGPFEPGGGRLDPAEEWVAAYLGPWREGFTDDVLLPALRLTPVAERAFQALTYDALVRSLEPTPRPVLAGVQADVLRRLADYASGH